MPNPFRDGNKMVKIMSCRHSVNELYELPMKTYQISWCGLFHCNRTFAVGNSCRVVSIATYEHKHTFRKFSFCTNYHLVQGNYFEIDIPRSKEQCLYQTGVDFLFSTDDGSRQWEQKQPDFLKHSTSPGFKRICSEAETENNNEQQEIIEITLRIQLG